MSQASPLRYPGGKASLTGLLADIRRANGLGATTFAEPFAGGAGASLQLLFLEDAPRIAINDADPSIHAFWWAVTQEPDAFVQMMRGHRVSMAEWIRQRATYRARRVSRLRRGFAAFYLNRTNRSGIIATGGPIGGLRQQGKWGIDARFNKSQLIDRVRRIAEYSRRIAVSGLDGLDYIRSTDWTTTMLFIDPPYYEKGSSLYLNGLDHRYHAALAAHLSSVVRGAWVLTYDDCPAIRALYDGWATVRPFRLRYAASERRRGREVLITPRWLQLPLTQASAAIDW